MANPDWNYRPALRPELQENERVPCPSKLRPVYTPHHAAPISYHVLDLLSYMSAVHLNVLDLHVMQTLDELHQIPEDIKQRAKDYMTTTKHHFRPMEPHEWPPKVVYKGWTKRSCPFQTTVKRLMGEEAEDEVVAGKDTGGRTAAVVAAPSDPGVDDDDFILPGFNGPTGGSEATGTSS